MQLLLPHCVGDCKPFFANRSSGEVTERCRTDAERKWKKIANESPDKVTGKRRTNAKQKQKVNKSPQKAAERRRANAEWK